MIARWLVPAALVVAGLSVSTPAQAAAPAGPLAGAAQVQATIRLAAGAGNVNGVLRSPKAKCRSFKMVTLMWRDNGADGFIKVAEDKSTRTGVWKVPGPRGEDIPRGAYYVKVPPSPGCQAARSGTIRVR